MSRILFNRVISVKSRDSRIPYSLRALVQRSALDDYIDLLIVQRIEGQSDVIGFFVGETEILRFFEFFESLRQMPSGCTYEFHSGDNEITALMDDDGDIYLEINGEDEVHDKYLTASDMDLFSRLFTIV